jgi:NAD(P)-dependent dehydrogenase (short-subunit alcohol dehydrogenase family)
MLLKNKVVLVTGAGRGWGRAICLAFARQGAQVIATARTQSELNGTASLIRSEGGMVETMQVDLSIEDEIQKLFNSTQQKYGILDVLVNNAAQLSLKYFEDMGMEEFDRVLTVNLRASVLLCKLFLPVMKRQGKGSIINVSSNAGIWGFEQESAYCTSKFAIEGFSRSLALEVQKYNIAVNTITPGGMTVGVRIKPTSLTQENYEQLSEAEKNKWVDSIRMTEAFIFLAMQDGSGMTGERILAYELSDQIRREGWNIQPAKENLQTQR